MTLKLQTTVVRVRNLEQAAQWYGQVLGFREAFRDLRVHARTFVLNNTTRITLYELEPDEPHRPVDRQSAYLVFVTDDIAAEADRLRQLGVDVGPIESNPGWRLFWIADPDGNRTMILQVLSPDL